MIKRLFTLATRFESLAKKGQKHDSQFSLPPASLTEPTPQFAVHSLPADYADTKLLATQMMNFDPTRWLNVSVDAEAMKKAGAALNNALNANNTAEIAKALITIMELSHDGGGIIYGWAKKLHAALQAAPKPVAAPAKAPAPAKTQWLDAYMKQEKAKEQMGDWADEQMKGYQAAPPKRSRRQK